MTPPAEAVMDALSLCLPTLIVVTALLRYRWYYFVLFAGIWASISHVSDHVMSEADGPTGIAVAFVLGWLIAFFAGIHGAKAVTTFWYVCHRRWSASTATVLVSLATLAAGVVTACYSPGWLWYAPFVVPPGLLYLSIHAPHGPRLVSVNNALAIVSVVGMVALTASLALIPLLAHLLGIYLTTMGVCLAAAHGIKGLLWLVARRMPWLRGALADPCA